MNSKFVIFFKKYIFKSLDSFVSSLLQVLVLIGLFIVFKNAIQSGLNKFWVNPIVSTLSDESLVYLTTIVLLVEIIYVYYQVRAKNFSLNTFEIFLLINYCYFRFFASTWVFYPYQLQVNLFDSVPIFIVISKIGSIVSFIYSIRIKTDLKEDKKGIIDPDLPLSELNSTDELSRSQFADDLASVLKETRPSERALVIGINGSWGAGKSSLQYLIKASLGKTQNSKSFYITNFNPWLYAQDKLLAHSFLQVVNQTLKRNHSIANSINNYAETLLKSAEAVETQLLSTSVLKDLRNNHSIEQELDEIKSRISDLKKTLIVIIDDLDRLSGEEIVEVFRLIRLVGDFPNTIYILSYDKEYVKSAISDKLSQHNPHLYLDKIVQVEYSIPESTVDNIRALFTKHLSKSMKLAVPDSVNQWSEEQINFLIKLELFNDSIKHVRDIKRFSNNFLLRYKLIYANVNFSQFFILELIRYKDPEFASIIFDEKSLFLERIKTGDFSLPEYSSLVPNPFWKALKKKNSLRDALKKTSEFRNEPHSISESFYFNHYFTLTLQEGLIANEEFNSVIKAELKEKQKTMLKEWLSNNEDMLIYRFRNYEALNSIQDFLRYIDHIAFVSNLIITKDGVSDGDRWERLPRIFVDQYLKLTGDNRLDLKELYNEVTQCIFSNGANESEALQLAYRKHIMFSIHHSDTPVSNGWRVFNQTMDLNYRVSPEPDPSKGKYVIFNAPKEIRYDNDIDQTLTFFLRNIKCEFKLFDSEDGAFYFKVHASKDGVAKEFLIRPSEQPSDTLGKISEDVYAIGLGVTIENGWRTFELNIEDAFLTTDLVMEGYKLQSVTGIAIKGKVGFGKFELY